ncbi:MAG: hypothetical protein ACLQNE_38060 [Thermoguttaceae bacterium]|jgi:hypothetical protein
MHPRIRVTNRPPSKPAAPRKESAPAPSAWRGWLLAAAIPLAICAAKLNLDFWYDEVYTLAAFVSKPWLQIVTDYSAPNNHIFYSLLLKPFYLLSDTEFFLRLPSLLFTAGTLAMVFRLSLRWGGLAAAMMATLALGLTQMFLVHTMQVRGYGLSMFLAIWLADLALPGPGATRWSRLVLIILVGTAFLYTLPSNLLVLLPLGLTGVVWSCLVACGAGGGMDNRPGDLRKNGLFRTALREAVAWGGACVLGVLLYLPVRDQLLSARGNSTVFGIVGMARAGGRVYYDALRDWFPILPLVVVGLFVWIGRTWRKGTREPLAIPLVSIATLVLPFVLAGVFGTQLFERNFCPILPLLAAAIGWLLAECLRTLMSRLRPAWSESAVGFLGMAVLVGVAAPSLWTYPARLTEYRRDCFAQDGYYNYYAANYHPAKVAAWLKSSIGPTENYTICFADADHFPLFYDLSRAGVAVNRSNGSGPRTIYLIAPDLVDYANIAKRFGVPEPVLRNLPLVRDFGYYRLYKSVGVARS